MLRRKREQATGANKPSEQIEEVLATTLSGIAQALRNTG